MPAALLGTQSRRKTFLADPPPPAPGDERLRSWEITAGGRRGSKVTGTDLKKSNQSEVNKWIDPPWLSDRLSNDGLRDQLRDGPSERASSNKVSLRGTEAEKRRS